MIFLGFDVLVFVYKYLFEEEIERLIFEILGVRSVDYQRKDEIIEEFYNIVIVQDYIF